MTDFYAEDLGYIKWRKVVPKLSLKTNLKR